MHKLFLLLLFSPLLVFAEEPSFDDQLISSQEYTKLVTNDRDNELDINNAKIRIDELETTNFELNAKIESLTDEIFELKDHGIKFGIDEEKLGKAFGYNQLQWREGDLIIASATIIGFFGFGSLLVVRFREKNVHEKMKLLTTAFAAIGSIEFIHILVILVIIFNGFNSGFYLFMMGLTFVFFTAILYSLFRIIHLENVAKSAENKNEDAFRFFMDVLGKL